MFVRMLQDMFTMLVHLLYKTFDKLFLYDLLYGGGVGCLCVFLYGLVYGGGVGVCVYYFGTEILCCVKMCSVTN